MSNLKATHFQPPGGVWTDEAASAHHEAMKAAWEKCKEYTRLYTRRGQRAHLSPPWSSSPLRTTLCPVQPAWPDEWLGTGSQAEYELAAELETCSRCRRAFEESQRCGNPECACQQWPAGER